MATTLATWTIDPVHSSVEFSLDYMGFSTYRTGFRTLEGSLEFDAARPTASSAKASRISGWRLSSVGAGYCSGSWAR
jgi:polyisoprenoid-binding protein YceI